MDTFKSIFKKSFLEGWANQQMSLESVTVTLLIATAIAIYIFFAYRILTRKTFYSKNFNISLVGVNVITAAIIVTIQSNIVISLGMVGALSIVRFRTAIKNPMDLMFLFWSISIGIICGAGFAVYAIVLSVILTLCVICLDKLPMAKSPMLLVVSSPDTSVEQSLIERVKKYSKIANVKARSVSNTNLNLTIEVRTDRGRELVADINAFYQNVGGINISLLSHDGEVTFS